MGVVFGKGVYKVNTFYYHCTLPLHDMTVHGISQQGNRLTHTVYIHLYNIICIQNMYMNVGVLKPHPHALPVEKLRYLIQEIVKVGVQHGGRKRSGCIYRCAVCNGVPSLDPER